MIDSVKRFPSRSNIPVAAKYARLSFAIAGDASATRSAAQVALLVGAGKAEFEKVLIPHGGERWPFESHRRDACARGCSSSRIALRVMHNSRLLRHVSSDAHGARGR